MEWYVIPCCMCMPPYANVVGNVFYTKSFKSIWDSPRYRNFRKQAVLNCSTMMPCKQCHIVN